MKIIPLTKRLVARVDDDDFEWISKKSWSVTFKKKCYARCSATGESMHRAILGARPGQMVDHKDVDTLNNQRSNLRFCLPPQNCANRPRTFRKRGRNHSAYKGVSFDLHRKKWRAEASRNHKANRRIAYFETEIQAAKAYDAFALELHKEFAYLNFPNGGANA